MTGATLYGTDESGHVRYQVEAGRVEQGKAGDPLEFTTMRLRYAPESEVDWNISAARGIASESLDQLQMLDDVLLTFTSDSNQDDLIFRSSELLIDAQDQRVETEAKVVLSKGNDQFVGEGLVVNLRTDAFSFSSEVTIGGSR
jgi:LPS export ABC transporter protein LptC